MISRSSAILLAALLSVPLQPRAACPQLPDSDVGPDEEITVDADSIQYDKGRDVVSASGDVVIRRGDTVLRADRVWLDRRTSEAEAEGDVSLTIADGIMLAREMRLDLEDETGSLIDAEIHSEVRGYSLWGERIEKGGGQQYRIENGRFTTCNCAEGPPSWSISGERLEVDVDGYGDLYGGHFNVQDFPVLPIPRAKFPVHRDRQSGFLLPRVGVSNRRGFQWLQPYYWAINRSHDATVAFDVETSARLGLLTEYRYALSRTFQGTINASYFNEAIRGKSQGASTSRLKRQEVTRNRWSVVTEHTQGIGAVKAYADAFVVSDDLFLREINTFTIEHARDVALRTLPFTTSRAGLLGGWERAFVQGEATVYQDLVGKPSLALQRLPDVRFLGQGKLGENVIGRNLFGTMEATATNFQRTTGITGIRGDIEPALQLRLPLGRLVSGSLYASVRGTAYQLTSDDMNCGFSGVDCPSANGALASEEFEATLDDNEVDLPAQSGRGVAELRADFKSGAARVFDFPFLGIDKLKHTIEPRLRYLYVPDVSQDDLPVFDTVDRINQRSLVAYGVASRLLARRKLAESGEGRDVRELIRLSILQGYDFSRKIPGVGLDGPADHFSDIDLALRVNPSPRTSVRLRSSYDTGDGELSFASAGIRLREPFGAVEQKGPGRLLNRTTFDGEYRFVRDNGIDPDTNNEVQQLNSGVILRLTNRIGFLYATRYNVRINRFLENHFGLRFLSACDCWGLDIGLSDKSNPNELEIRAQLTLVGLGSAGTGTPFD